MFAFLLVLHVIICIALTVVILLQSSKGGGLSGVFGGGGASSGTLFSGRGVASFLHKVTIGLASAFVILCLLLGSQIFKGQREAYDDSLTRKARSQRKVSSSSSVIPAVPGAFDEKAVGDQAAPAKPESPKAVESQKLPEKESDK